MGSYSGGKNLLYTEGKLWYIAMEALLQRETLEWKHGKVANANVNG